MDYYGMINHAENLARSGQGPVDVSHLDSGLQQAYHIGRQNAGC